MNNNFDEQISQIEELIARSNMALEFLKKLRDTDEVTVEDAMKVGLVFVEINENGKITNKQLMHLNPNAIIKGVENIDKTTLRCTKLEESE